MKNMYLGRHVLGAAAILFGIVTLTFGDFNIWQQVGALGKIPHHEILAYVAAAIEILGGIAIQRPQTARMGAIALGGIYSAFALFWVPRIIAEPAVYDRWGNFFEQLSQVAGALIVYAGVAHCHPDRESKMTRVGYILFSVCMISFTLEQLVYLSGTAGFVPKWIPGGQMFWAVTTTIAFALAAIALLTGVSALLAARLTTVMMVGFGLLVWLPAPFADPHQLTNWAGNAENLSIAAAAWIVADLLSRNRVASVTAEEGASSAPAT